MNWDEFAALADADSNESCVPPELVQRMTTNSVLLMKGSAWPGIRGEGLTHRSPEVQGDAVPKRLLLKVDLHVDRPPLGTEDMEEWDGERV